MSSVFISYARPDREFAQRLATDLTSAGHDVSFDVDMLGSGASFATQLAGVIERADAVLAVLSRAYTESNWASQEVALAFAGDARRRDRRLIPLLIEDCDPPPMLAALKAADFRNGYGRPLKEVLAALDALNADSVAQGSGSVVVGNANVVYQHVPDAAEADEMRAMLAEMRTMVEALKRPAPGVTAAPQRERTSQCFVVMPFSDEDLQVVYEDYIKPVAERELRLTCERGDDVFGSEVIMDDIVASIERADIVVADLTRRNPNVFYEVGMCHALGKPVLLLSQSMDDVPFDLRHRRVLIYDYTPRGVKRLETLLAENLHAMLPPL